MQPVGQKPWPVGIFHNSKVQNFITTEDQFYTKDANFNWLFHIIPTHNKSQELKNILLGLFFFKFDFAINLTVASINLSNQA